MASIEIKATRMDKTVTFDLPCREKELEEQLSVLYGTPPSHAVIEVEQVAFPRELGMLTGKMLDLDALNYLARRIDGFDYGEANAFFEGIKAEGMSELKDLINLTDNLNRYSLITNIGSYAEIGRQHTLNTKGSIPTAENETPEQTEEYGRIGRELIGSGTGKFTEHGLLFVDRETEFVTRYDGTAFPPYYDNSDCMMYATLAFNGQEELLFLPEEETAINKAVRRLGAGTLSDCDITLERCNAGTAANLYESVYQNEGFMQMNSVMNSFDRLSPAERAFLSQLLEYSGFSSAENIAVLSEHLDDLYLIPETTPSDVAEYVLDEGTEYHADTELWDFIDMDALGNHYINQHGAEFIEGGLLCSYNGDSVQEILDQLEPEQGIRFRQ